MMQQTNNKKDVNRVFKTFSKALRYPAYVPHKARYMLAGSTFPRSSTAAQPTECKDCADSLHHTFS